LSLESRQGPRPSTLGLSRQEYPPSLYFIFSLFYPLDPGNGQGFDRVLSQACLYLSLCQAEAPPHFICQSSLSSIILSDNAKSS
jgi:hypothetical protein